MTDSLSAGSRAAADVSALLRARNPLIWIVTREEARVERLLLEAASTAQYPPLFWDCATGITDFSGAPKLKGTDATDPVVAINTIRDSRSRNVWILRDLHKWFDPIVLRAMRSLCRSLPQATRDEARAIIMITPSAEVPPELAGHAIVIEWPLPDRSEVAAILDSAIEALPDDIRATASPNGTRDAAIDAAVGLTEEEARSCYAKSLVSTKRIDPVAVAAEKKRVIARERVLEWIDPLPGGLESVGGLDAMKDWLVARKTAFSPRARDFGLDAPRGVMLVGVSGCGKSMTAKAVGTAWEMPLLRLDLGALKSKYVGDSEANIRKALRVAETVSPCILWLDEIEKAFAGATQGAADGGVSSDALGAVLSWMQDRAGSVFVVATANDVSQLPPELLRKGRFDEIFFVDLPNDQERAAVLRSSLKSHARTDEGLDMPELVAATRGFTGAEIAAVVPDALFTAFADGERALSQSDLLAVAATTVPLSRTAAEKIDALKRWANDRARPATAVSTAPASSQARALDLS